MKKLLVCASLMTAFVTRANAMSDENSKDEMRCPPKPFFKALVEKNIGAEEFKFEIGRKFWQASHFQTFNENAEEIPSSTFSTPISQLQLTYEVNSEDENSASAQFFQNNRLVSAIRLDRFYPQPTEDGRNEFEVNCPNKNKFRNLMEENIDKIVAKTPFSFEIDGQKWKVLSIQQYDEDCRDCTYSKAELSNFINKKFIYNADFNDPTWATAQFPQTMGGRNALVIRIDRTE